MHKDEKLEHLLL